MQTSKEADHADATRRKNIERSTNAMNATIQTATANFGPPRIFDGIKRFSMSAIKYALCRGVEELTLARIVYSYT